jgi:ABC-2 type transport system ATP-binding protein
MDSRPNSPLATVGITRRFGNVSAVDDVDLTVESGEIHALVGLNGAGKTTLMRLILGMLRPSSGRSFVDGVDTTRAESGVWSKVGHTIEAPFAYPELTVVQNLTAAARLHGIASADTGSAAEKSIARFNLGSYRDTRTRTLSLGNRQRLGLASALINNPSIVVLDEPTNALDPAGVVFMRDMLRELAAQGAAVLVSSHHLDEMARTADRISAIHRGRLVASIDPQEIDIERKFFEIVRQAEEAWGPRDG